MRLFLSCFLLCALLACHTTSAHVPKSEFQQASEALQAKKPKEALPILERLFQKDSSQLEVARALAEAHVQLGQSQTLLARLQNDVRPVAFYMRGLLFYSHPSTAENEALAAFQQAIAAQPAEPEFHYRLGLALLELERDAQALAVLQTAIGLAPEKTSWQLPLAKALFRLGKNEMALTALGNSLDNALSPAELQTAKTLMNALIGADEHLPAPAQQALDEAIHWLNVADVPQQAVTLLEGILLDFPDLATAHALLGLAYQRLDDAGRATEEFKKAISLAPNNGLNHFYLAELYASKRRPQEAKKEYEQAIKKNPFLDNAYLKLGEMATQQANWPLARQYFQTAVYLGNTQARLSLALCFQAENNWSAAETEFLLLLNQMPNNLELQLRAGAFYVDYFLAASSSEEKTQLRKKALPLLDKVLEAQPENALASRAKAMLKKL
ncbi:MAG: tetratricopeptide repeat protein [Cystobacterineae bacterium]|nr:tetratricopeptide repeat protein [Cystobacterineae bacterium]